MLEFLKGLDSKTITLGLVLAAGLCWPVLHFTQIEPRDKKIAELEGELAEIKGELKELRAQSIETLKPYHEQLRLLTENKALIEAKNSFIEQQLSQYRDAYEKSLEENSELGKKADLLSELRSLQEKKDKIENSISFQQSGSNTEYIAQLERQSEQIQSRIISLQSGISSNNLTQPTANTSAD
jgi:chromosome segregation ATPase